MHQRRNGSAVASKASEGMSNPAKFNVRGCNNQHLVHLVPTDNMESTTHRNAAMSSHLPAATALGAAHLRVADLSRSIAFYGELLGMIERHRDTDSADLGTSTKTLVHLDARPGLPPRPHDAPGLFHVAILLPDRPALGAMLKRLSSKGIRLGASDHIVSEAVYLSDPDGNGIEIYRDRPRDNWGWHNGQVEMATDHMDTRAVLAQAAPAREPYRLPEGTRIGHLHLQVGDLAQARRFYVDGLGFEVTTEDYPGALFVSAGGYHHHIGLNVWHSRGGGQAPQDRAGLARMNVELPAEADLVDVRSRLENAGLSFTTPNDGLSVRDPWGNEVMLTVKPAV